MSLTRSEIISKARIGLATEDTSVFTSDRLNSAFNDLIQLWSEKTRSLSREYPRNLVADTADYDLTADEDEGGIPLAYEIRRVRVLPATGSQPLDVDYVPLDMLPPNKATDRGTPDVWSTRGMTTLILWPTPGTSITEGLLVDAYIYPTPLGSGSAADETALPFPVSHRLGLELGMKMMMCEIGLEDDTLANRYPLYAGLFEKEADKRGMTEADPSSRPPRWGGRGGGRRWGRYRTDRYVALP